MKIRHLILSLTLLVPSNGLIAMNALEVTIYSLDGGELKEKYGDNWEIRYDKIPVLPTTCRNQAPPAIDEIYSTQPTVEIQGYWQNKEIVGSGSPILHIRPTGQADIYITHEQSCEIYVMGELDGNTFTQEVVFPH